jgi:hypothetical protein
MLANVVTRQNAISNCGLIVTISEEVGGFEAVGELRLVIYACNCLLSINRIDRTSPCQAYAKTIEVLLQWILRNEQMNLRALQRVLDTLALVGEGRRKVKLRPSIIHALLDFTYRTTAALIVGNESRKRLAFFSDEDVVFSCIDCSLIDRAVNAAFGGFECLPGAVCRCCAAAILDLHRSGRDDVVNIARMIMPRADVARRRC